MSDQDVDPQEQPTSVDPKDAQGKAIPEWIFWLVPVLVALLLRPLISKTIGALKSFELGRSSVLKCVR